MLWLYAMIRWCYIKTRTESYLFHWQLVGRQVCHVQIPVVAEAEVEVVVAPNAELTNNIRSPISKSIVILICKVSWWLSVRDEIDEKAGFITETDTVDL